MPGLPPAHPWEFRTRAVVMLLSVPVTAAIAGSLRLVTGRWFAPDVALPVLIASAVLGSIGFFLRVWGTATLTPASMIRNSARGDVLIESGPFAWVRNPLYLGTQLILAGWSLWYGWRVAIPFVLFHAVRFQRIVLYEESLLQKERGAEFEDYASRVGRWVPKSRARQSDWQTVWTLGAILSNGPLGGMAIAMIIAAATGQTLALFPGIALGLLASQAYFSLRRRNQAAAARSSATPISAGRE